MNDNHEWVVWNGSLGVLDMAALGRVEHDAAGRNAWLAAPYDVVGPFNLDELEAMGRVAFGACLVMSRRKWREDQIELRIEAREKRRAFAQRFVERDDEDAHRETLDLPLEGVLSAAEINAAFRRLAKTAHPDAGGDHDAYIRLAAARDALLK
ncbi:J domain-containing protein [Rhodoblastus acidophilus]|uniref:J domain-containing protein n=1 Tax=Candidatus Rhodoblastus alkanivorans TaxID=2954117 RepID=A0ABS9Z2N3_9HYPH|nr:J domain-containing protein [Candidatus Rhodoblastus alkanivorans]MCI4678566.1 J domain-containing protein [Candidatus Rhodoblastus alkanivorans]MCI4681346.1 J domain-containing protein [Candidatus Rhodoblastus alkanivorans]MDI4642394.1 J domain-containing protein [Rhodoblastus acidophilus]